MSWDFDKDNGFIFEELDCHYNDYYDCPRCGSHNVHTKRSYEDADTDGNRGTWVTYVDKCFSCGYRDDLI